MKTQSPDTSPEMEKLYFDLLRRAGIAKRLERMGAWSDAMIAVSKSAIARAHPDWDERQITREWARQQHGDEVMLHFGI